MSTCFKAQRCPRAAVGFHTTLRILALFLLPSTPCPLSRLLTLRRLPPRHATPLRRKMTRAQRQAFIAMQCFVLPEVLSLAIVIDISAFFMLLKSPAIVCWRALLVLEAFAPCRRR